MPVLESPRWANHRRRVHNLAAGLSLIAIASCGDGGNSARSEGQLGEFRTLPAGSLVREVALTRHSRTAAGLAAHAAAVAGFVVDDTLPGSQATQWATDALAVNEFETYSGLPFSGYPDLHVSYTAYFDTFVAINTGVGRPTLAELESHTPNTGPDVGIGKTSAKSIASSLVTDMKNAGAIPNDTYVLSSTHQSTRALHREISGGEDVYSEVSDFVFLYRRTSGSLPIINSVLRITVHRDGEIASIRFDDIGVVQTDRIRTLTSDDAAFVLMKTQAKAGLLPTGAPHETLLRNKQVGFFLQADVDPSATVAPVAMAKIVFRENGSVSRARGGVIALDVSSPKFALLPSAARPAPALRASGEICTDDGQCSSSECFVFPGVGGICGYCDEDADCAWGCNHPGMLTDPPVPSVCGDGDVGTGCESNGACMSGLLCSEVATAGFGYTLKTCGECSVDSDCSPTQVCGVAFDFSRQEAYRACEKPADRGFGSICESNGQCASNKCDTYGFVDGTQIGVCGKCTSDPDCTSPATCRSTTFDFTVGFSHSLCQ